MSLLKGTERTNFLNNYFLVSDLDHLWRLAKPEPFMVCMRYEMRIRFIWQTQRAPTICQALWLHSPAESFVSGFMYSLVLVLSHKYYLRLWRGELLSESTVISRIPQSSGFLCSVARVGALLHSRINCRIILTLPFKHICYEILPRYRTKKSQQPNITVLLPCAEGQVAVGAHVPGLLQMVCFTDVKWLILYVCNTGFPQRGGGRPWQEGRWSGWPGKLARRQRKHQSGYCRLVYFWGLRLKIAEHLLFKITCPLFWSSSPHVTAPPSSQTGIRINTQPPLPNVLGLILKAGWMVSSWNFTFTFL